MKNKTKYGVIWAPTPNIGDDIQTLAAINFLQKKRVNDYVLVNREELNSYSGEPINVLMNGWFIHNINHYPPSDKIKPIFISFHIARPKLIQRNINYFKKYEPIGCRDQATVNLFKEHGIDAYFTGCLTLFFDTHIKKSNKKYFVDVNTDCDYIPNVKINLKLFKDFETVKHDTFKHGHKDIETRLELAKELLSKYSSASLVVTTRLHCALPCRSLGTNCIFIHKNYATDPRFQGLHDVLNGDAEYHTSADAKPGSINKIKQFFSNFKLDSDL